MYNPIPYEDNWDDAKYYSFVRTLSIVIVIVTMDIRVFWSDLEKLLLLRLSLRQLLYLYFCRNIVITRIFIGGQQYFITLVFLKNRKSTHIKSTNIYCQTIVHWYSIIVIKSFYFVMFCLRYLIYRKSLVNF